MSWSVQCFVCLCITGSLNLNRSCIHLHTLHYSLCEHKISRPIEHSALVFNQIMVSSSASRKTTKKAIAKPVEQHDSDDNNESGFLTRWFGDNMESINEYHREFSHKTFVNPKFLRMKFVKLSGNIYPDLVKVFLTNMWIDDGVIYSQVEGVDMAITNEVWLSVAGLRDAGTIVSRANVADLGGFDKVQFFKTCLRNPNSSMRSYSVGGLSIIPRLLSYIVIWILTPR